VVHVEELILRYERLSTPLVYDILDRMGFPHQVLSPRIRPLMPGKVLAGPAFTFEGVGIRPEEYREGIAYQMFREITPGAVLVFVTHGHRLSAPWGENTSLSAQLRGARGLITDGCVRDVNGIMTLKFPVFCAGVTPVLSSGRFWITSFQQPVEVEGHLTPTITVRPGDFILADDDGVVVIPSSLAEDVLIAAERLEWVEEQIRSALRAGEDREVVYRRFPKFEHVKSPES
jgi:4-hydroxy-4-methyl-2-oxoglutarate aldolase